MSLLLLFICAQSMDYEFNSMYRKNVKNAKLTAGQCCMLAGALTMIFSSTQFTEDNLFPIFVGIPFGLLLFIIGLKLHPR